MIQLILKGLTIYIARYKVDDAYFIDEDKAKNYALSIGKEEADVETLSISEEDKWIEGIELPFTRTPNDDAQTLFNNGENAYLQNKYLPSEDKSAIAFTKELLKTTELETDTQKIRVGGLWDEWTEGKHTTGEIYTARGQVWECFADYDTNTYPGLVPGSSAWSTFNRPLHGTTVETAMPWVQPTNATDQYKIGEYMVWKEDKIYKCIMNTNFSPDEYALAWELVE